MYYQPHKLYARRTVLERDEYNRPIYPAVEKEVFICGCRCDDNDTQEFTTENGRVFRPKYHIVCPENVDVECNEDIIVYNGGMVRGKGKVYNIKRLNVLKYSEIWV